MKKVPCANTKECPQRRIHFEEPDTPRGTQYIEVPDDYKGPAYCSITCAVLAGAIKLRVNE